MTIGMRSLHTGVIATQNGASETNIYPHGISCRQCRIEERCNYCGEFVNTAMRCTNGRDSVCCKEHCDHRNS